MNEMLALSGEMREYFGTGAARALRRTDMVPAIVYGPGKKTLSISIEEKEITKYYRKPNFISTIIQLEIGEKKHKVMPKIVELHPITDVVRHVDFIFLDNKHQKMELPIIYEGKERSIGVKRGGFFNIVKRTLTIMAPSNNIPKNVIIDVSNMYIGQSIKADSIKLPEGCKLLNNSNQVIASIIGRGGKGDETIKVG